MAWLGLLHLPTQVLSCCNRRKVFYSPMMMYRFWIRNCIVFTLADLLENMGKTHPNVLYATIWVRVMKKCPFITNTLLHPN